MLGDERFGIGGGLVEDGQGGGLSQVSEGDANVPQKAATFGAEDGSAGKFTFEGGVVEFQQFEQVRLGQIAAGVSRHELADAGKFIPRTGSETIVAAVDAVADGWA